MFAFVVSMRVWVRGCCCAGSGAGSAACDDGSSCKPLTGGISEINSEREANSETGRMDSQRAAGQGDTKAHSTTHRAPYGRPQAP